MIHNPKKSETKTTFIACHAEGHGGGHFSDVSFNTIEEAQEYIDTRADSVSEEYRAYWKAIASNMFIVECTAEYKPVHSKTESFNVYHPFNDKVFIGYVMRHRGKWTATPDETAIQHRADSKQEAIRWLETYSGCHL